MVKSALFEYWKQAELERGERITVADVVRSTGLQRNTVQGMLDGETTRYDAPVIDALCKYFAVVPGPVPFLVYELDK
jgi:DNA-binding Xre family transcriptional regulator